MIRIRSHKRRFSGSPHFLPEIVNRNERVILETHNSLDHSSQLEGQLTNKYIILNYPYDIINNSWLTLREPMGISIKPFLYLHAIF